MAGKILGELGWLVTGIEAEAGDLKQDEAIHRIAFIKIDHVLRIVSLIVDGGIRLRLVITKGVVTACAVKSPGRAGAIDIDLGHARVRIEGAADPDCVRAALEGLR